MMPVIVLVLGTGGREHAIYAALLRDPAVTAVHVAPGNPGIPAGSRHPLDMLDTDAVAALAKKLSADLIVVGPEAPLVEGVAGELRRLGFAVFGPDADAARLEGSKAFAKDVMAAAGVPTAAARVCVTPDEVAAALDEFGAPYVVKNDGLAAGKGVVVTADREAACAHAAACGRVVIEEYLDGPEVSLFVVCDGTTGIPLAPAQDFKRVGDGDTGPNTGGMGAYSPLPWAPDGLVDEVMASVVEPTLAEMSSRGTPFVGLLYVGLALTSRGVRVVEFNARFGDPETQVVLARLESPCGRLLYAAATGSLTGFGPLTWSDDAAVVVVVAAAGYPGTPASGGEIVLPPDTPTAYTLHAGTRLDGDTLVASGGRVLGVVGRGSDLHAARASAYAHVDAIAFADGFCRRDIALVASQGGIVAPESA